jgi:hypothetical protein
LEKRSADVVVRLGSEEDPVAGSFEYLQVPYKAGNILAK